MPDNDKTLREPVIRISTRANDLIKAAASQNAASMPHVKFRKLQKTGFALSGGGAKGSFQIGALRFLMEMRGIKPDLLAGTSVGAVNAAKLAEGSQPPDDDPDYKPGLAGLVDIWHNLKNDEDMAEPIVDFQKLMTLVKDEATEAAGDLVGTGVAAALLGGLPFITCLAEAAVADNVETVVKAVRKALFSGGIYSLQPVRNMIRDKKKFRPDLFAESKIETFLCWVGMLSGETFYVDNRKRLYVAPNFTKPVGKVDTLTDTIHASAAIPLIFKSPVVKGEWNGKEFAELGYDGGVTEIAPVEVLAAHGATQIFAILCAPKRPASLLSGEAGEAQGDVFEKYTAVEFNGNVPEIKQKFVAESPAFRFLLTVGTRGLDLATSEVLEGDLQVKVDELNVIRPYVIVHDTQRIHPELIAINEAHGWMCAFDQEIPAVITGKDGKKVRNENKRIAMDLNKAITLARRDKAAITLALKTWKKIQETGLISKKQEAAFTKGLQDQLPAFRKTIREGAELRAKTFGLDSLPLDFGTWDD